MPPCSGGSIPFGRRFGIIISHLVTPNNPSTKLMFDKLAGTDIYHLSLTNIAVAACRQDRVARDELHWFTLEAVLKVLRVRLVTVTGSTDTRNEDSLPSDIDAILAAREAKNIRERTMRGKVASARAGSWLGGTPP